MLQLILSDLLMGLASCIPHTEKYPDAADEVIRRGPALLKVIWERREYFSVEILDKLGFEPTIEAVPEQDSRARVRLLQHIHTQVCLSHCDHSPA